MRVGIICRGGVAVCRWCLLLVSVACVVFTLMLFVFGWFCGWFCVVVGVVFRLWLLYCGWCWVWRCVWCRRCCWIVVSVIWVVFMLAATVVCVVCLL